MDSPRRQLQEEAEGITCESFRALDSIYGEVTYAY
jgi:hypothetical protein